MSRGDNLKRGMDDLKRGIKRAVEESVTRAEDADGEDAHNINVAGRVNKAVATNIGEPGSVQGVSSKQKVRIRQNGDETYEETETIKTSF